MGITMNWNLVVVFVGVFLTALWGGLVWLGAQEIEKVKCEAFRRSVQWPPPCPPEPSDSASSPAAGT